MAPNLPIAGNDVATRLRSANLGSNGGGVIFTPGTTATVTPRTSQVPPTRQIRALRNLSVDMEDNPNSGGRSEEARVLIEYVFSATLASELGNPAGFKQAME